MIVVEIWWERVADGDADDVSWGLEGGVVVDCDGGVGCVVLAEIAGDLEGDVVCRRWRVLDDLESALGAEDGIH